MATRTYTIRVWLGRKGGLTPRQHGFIFFYVDPVIYGANAAAGRDSAGACADTFFVLFFFIGTWSEEVPTSSTREFQLTDYATTPTCQAWRN